MILKTIKPGKKAEKWRMVEFCQINVSNQCVKSKFCRTHELHRLGIMSIVVPYAEQFVHLFWGCV